jgi:cob(I)alamin adenosyltransferase
MKYRYGWKSAEMIHYYSEFMGMKDTITDEDMLIDTTKAEIQQMLQKEQQKVAILQEQLMSQKQDTDQRIKQLEAMMLQKFAEQFSQ